MSRSHSERGITSFPNLHKFSMKNALTEYMAYPFHIDEAYQHGIASMFADGATVDPNMPTNVNEDVLLRMKVFYFNRVTGNHLTVEQIHGSSTASELPSSTSEREDEMEPRIFTFAELQDLIGSGKVDRIPNNKIIPDKLNESPPSESKVVARKKPWEITSVELPKPTGCD